MYLFERRDFSKGFTIIEILVVIGILVVLFAIVLIAVNPKRQIDLAKDTQRKSNLSELRKSLVQYFIEKKTYPSSDEWSGYLCGSTESTGFSPYLAAIPCDPDTGQKYYYEPLTESCQICPEDQTCKAFRILTQLSNISDPAIQQAGCDPYTGCGFVFPSGFLPNYGLSSGCNIAISPQASPTGPTITASPIPGASSTPSVTPDLTSSPAPSPSTTPPSVSVTPSFTLTPTPTVPSNVTTTPAFIPDISYDAQRVSDLLSITLALEKYKFINGSYPSCGAAWESVQCLSGFINSMLFNNTLPIDPENGDPYIYVNYPGGFCLGAHLADAVSRISEINCPIGAPLPVYSYRIRERNEIIYRPLGNLLDEIVKDARDAQRKNDLQIFTADMEKYKSDFGHYPNCWTDPDVWVTTGSGDFFCGGQFTAYSTSYNPDPGGVNPYIIVQWDPGGDGYFRKYCFGAYMDKGNNTNCLLDCPANNYDSNYCYFTKNP